LAANPVALLIEPHDDTRALYNDYFRFRGWDTLQASDGATGVALAIAHHPDAVVSALRMPGLDGTRVIVMIRDDARTVSIPIVIVTTETRETVLDAARQAGANVILTKPTTPDQIVAAVNGANRQGLRPRNQS
jgi:DNA-binding response OmpR family regulator